MHGHFVCYVLRISIDIPHLKRGRQLKTKAMNNKMTASVNMILPKQAGRYRNGYRKSIGIGSD